MTTTNFDFVLEIFYAMSEVENNIVQKFLNIEYH